MTARIEPLRERDAAAAGELLAASHDAYPAYQVLWPNPQVRRRVLCGYLTGIARDAAAWGGAVLAKDGPDAVGATLWLPPGAFPLAVSRKLRLTPSMLRMAGRGPRSALSFALLGARLARGGGTGPSWYLRAMGVRPEARRRGIGALLLAPVLARADEEGVRCRLHLADPTAVPYYQSHGFQLTGLEVPLPWHAGSASYVAMVRAPR
jgi:GNAT superfamily N-acetyltransferase